MSGQEQQLSERELLIRSQQIQDRRSGRTPDSIVTESSRVYRGEAVWNECFNKIHNMIFDDLVSEMNLIGMDHKRTDNEIIIEFTNGSKGEITFTGNGYNARVTTKDGKTRYEGSVNSKADFIEYVLNLA